MTGDDDVWEGIEFEVHEPTDTIQVPFVDHLFANSDGYQSDALSEYNDELQPKENYLTVSVPEQWISVMNSPAVSVLSVDLNSPVIPYDNVDQFTTQDPTLDPNDLSNYTFDDFLAYQSWYQPDPSDLSQFGETSQQSFPSSQIPADGLGIFNTNVEGISNQDSSQFDLESLNFKATMDQSQFLFKGEPKSPNQSDRSLEFEKTRGQNILPDGRFWNMIKSNGSVLFGCPWEGCQKTFTRPFNLKGHYNGHLGIKEFICDTVGCEKMFRRKADLKRHQRQHKYFFLISGQKNYICEACGKPFARKDALDRHLNPGTKESACKLRIQLNRLQQQNDTQERPLKRSKVE